MIENLIITASIVENTFFVAAVIIAVVLLGFIALIVKWYKKAIHGRALVRTGTGGTRVTFDKGFFVIPVLHRLEIIDITLKTVVISRTGIDGLICKDNMRADIKVAFFVRVNNTVEDVKKVALSIGCARASSQDTLVALFDAKFSEALKTVGKKFEFVELYTEREKFKHEILQVIGTDLNGYNLDDCAIDYLEQTPLESLKKDNILDSEGIKKITERTSTQLILANQIQRDKEKTITKQNVEAQETILQLNRQLAEKEEQQRREIANIKDREQAEIEKVAQEQRLKSEQARIQTDETVQIADENRERQVIVARKNKEKTEAVEQERVMKEQQLEATERERIVAIAAIEKEKAVEEEKRKIQEVIRERVIVEKAVVQEEEKIKDTKAYAGADRDKKVAITNAEKLAEQALVREIKNAEAAKKSSEFKAEQIIIEAEAEQASASNKAEAMKILAEAKAAEEAALGKSEALVIEAKALALKKQGETDANIIEVKALAEAKSIKAKSEAEAEATLKIGKSEADVNKQKGVAEADIIQAKAKAEEQKGLAEARVISEKYSVEAQGINEKAEAMKKLDAVGKDHEEFKLKLQADLKVRLANIKIQKDIAFSQAKVIGESLKAANIDIVGGETMFFDQIIGAISRGKSFDRMLNNSNVLTDLKNQFFNSEDGKSFKENFQNFVDQFGIKLQDVKDLSISALLFKLAQQTDDKKKQTTLEKLLDLAISKGIADTPAKNLFK